MERHSGRCGEESRGGRVSTLLEVGRTTGRKEVSEVVANSLIGGAGLAYLSAAVLYHWRNRRKR